MTGARDPLVDAYRVLETAPIADAVAAAYTPSGPSRDELTRRIRARRGLAPLEGNAA